MTDQPRDLVFLSYSRKDPQIYTEVRQRLIDQGLGDSLWDDTEIRLGERWDPKIQEGMDRAAVAVLILSDGYFGRRKGGGEYILEQELPYLIEHWQAGELDLLPIYWRPSPHFAPDRRDPIKPFVYRWERYRASFRYAQHPGARPQRLSGRCRRAHSARRTTRPGGRGRETTRRPSRRRFAAAQPDPGPGVASN